MRRKAAPVANFHLHLQPHVQHFLITDAALCARSAITDTRAAAYRPLQLQPSTHHGAPDAPRVGTLALAEQAPPAAAPAAAAGHEDEVLFEESPICGQPVRSCHGPCASMSWLTLRLCPYDLRAYCRAHLPNTYIWSAWQHFVRDLESEHARSLAMP